MGSFSRRKAASTVNLAKEAVDPSYIDNLPSGLRAMGKNEAMGRM
jgi:hypothetical protein